MSILPIALILIVSYLVFFYNSVKTLKIKLDASIQEIGNQLKRQTNLIPNLIESVKGFLKQEKSIFENLTEARKLIDSGKTENIDKSQQLINKALGSLKLVVESNPQIQSQQLVGKLMEELTDTADKIMYSRRTLIDLTADYNTKISTIPGIWLASLFHFQPQAGLQIENIGSALKVSSQDTQNPQVNL